MVQLTTDKVRVIKKRMKEAQDRQKSYADNRRRPIEFQVGDKVFLKVAPWKGIIRFGVKGKLAPRYIGPFEIKERIGAVHIDWNCLYIWIRFITCSMCHCCERPK